MSELHLRVFRDKSELVLPDGTAQVFLEGGMSQSARLRYQKITIELSNGYLAKQIIHCRVHADQLDFLQLKQIHIDTLSRLVDSVTSEGLLNHGMQNTVKLTYVPELEEIADKLEAHPTVALAGFVTSVEPERQEEIVSRC